jgi:thiol-disulfide isomerase/thioredoxin
MLRLFSPKPNDRARHSLKVSWLGGIVRFLFLLVSLFVLVLAASAQDADPGLQVQPHLLQPGEHGIGQTVPDVTVKDLAGHELALSRLQGGKPLVILMFSAFCPVSDKYGPELARLETDYTNRGVAFLFVDSISSETITDLLGYVSNYHLHSPVVPDPRGALAQVLEATTTTEAFVLDPARTLVYRGAINDQYGLGYTKGAPLRTYLRDALDAVLQGRHPAIAATTAPGCNLDLPAVPVTTQTDLTYYREISRIFQANCVDCHHVGGNAPFSLETLSDVVGNAGRIRQAVVRGAMPPWFAAKLPGQTESPWANDRSLSDRDKTDLLAWLNSDCPAGDPADAPITRVYSTRWKIGEPDVVLQLPQPIPVKAEGFMPYQYRTIQTSFPEDRWVQAYQIMPTARAVVHHVIVSLDTNNDDSMDSLLESGATGFWAVYVPGFDCREYPPGFARKLPAGAKLKFQIHYTPNGRATDEQLRIGLVFAKEPPQYEIHTLGIPQLKLDIPPGVHRHVETAEYHVTRDMEITGYQAHTHLRGVAFRYDLLKTNGASEVLLDLPRYDFNWQLQYDYIHPKLVPAGSTIKVSAVYDNSADNPANPDPTREVKWGNQTYDEMMIGYVEYFRPALPAISSSHKNRTGLSVHPHRL